MNNAKYNNCHSLQHENKIGDVTYNIEHSIKLAMCKNKPIIAHQYIDSEITTLLLSLLFSLT